MSVIHLDETLPLDDCPATRYVPVSQREGLRERLKKGLKAWIYRRLSGRPKRTVPPIPENPQCVLVATGGNLGGAIISIPLIEAVRKRWPDCHLAVVSNRQHGLEIVERAGFGDSFHLAPETSLARMLIRPSYWNFRRRILDFSPDLFIGNHNFSLNHTIPLHKIPVTIGHIGSCPQGSNLDEGAVYFDYKVTSFAGQNWLDSYQAIATLIGNSDRSRPRIIVSSDQRKFGLKRLQDLGLKEGMVCVGIQASVWEKEIYRAWSTENMAEMCTMLWKDLGVVPVIIGSKGQNELTRFLRDHRSNTFFIDCVDQFSTAELPALVAVCAAVVSNDSGLMHLSAAVGTATLAIYGMSNPDITWVYGDDPNHKIVRRGACVPCNSGSWLAENCPSRPCLNHIMPKTVLNELLNMLRDSVHTTE